MVSYGMTYQLQVPMDSQAHGLAIPIPELR